MVQPRGVRARIRRASGATRRRATCSAPASGTSTLSFSRNVNLPRGKRVELRVEAFNLFNHSNWANPTVQIGSTALTNGRVTNTTGDPRIMQFAFRYGF